MGPILPDIASRGGPVDVVAIPGFEDPGPVVRDGELLYVGNTADNDANLITVVDISAYGAETVVDDFDTPVNPVDLAVANDFVYVIDQERTPLFFRPLAGETWSSIDLPNAEITQWTYGNIIFPYPLGNKMLVIHMWEDLIDVVNLDTNDVEHVIDELTFCPDRIVFTEDRMIVLGICLSAPDCSASGPNFSVFDLATFEKLYQKDITGACALTLVELDGLIYVVSDNSIKSYDLDTGDLMDTFNQNLLGRNAAVDGASIIYQRSDGVIRKIDPTLTTLGEGANLLEDPQIWYPPIEEMVALDASDGRAFITNRNDNTLSIAYFTPAEVPCDGDVNGDNIVDPLDSGYVLSRFGCSVGTGDPECDAADANTDGIVDPLDVGYVLSRFGECP